MRGRAVLKECFFCGKRQPIDKMVRSVKYSFSFFDERSGVKHRGNPETIYCCPSCARHRGIKDLKPRKGRPKKR